MAERDPDSRNMQVSVIIPVYNAEQYVREAVESALTQPETGEVILIEDGSTDHSLPACQDLTAAHPRVRLLRHDDGKNHGAGASRNVGIRDSKCLCISFLDADDFYLPGRFTVAAQILAADPTVDGVYEAVGVHFEDDAARQKWLQRNLTRLTTMTERVDPDGLFEAQAPIGLSGYCPTGGWVVKRTLFEKTGLFDEHLRLHQDTAMYVKFAARGRMVPGRLDEPVAMRRVHDQNRFLAPRSAFDRFQNRIRMWGTLWRWGKRNLPEERRQILLERFLNYALSDHPGGQRTRFWLRSLRWGCQLALVTVQHPDLILESQFWSSLPGLSPLCFGSTCRRHGPERIDRCAEGNAESSH